MSLEEETVDITDFRSKLMRFVSTDKQISTQNNSNFTVNLRSLGGPVDNVKGFIVKYISLPNVFDNVPSGKNILRIEDNNDPGNVKDVVITPGQYNINDLLVELKTQIDAVLSVGSVAVALVSDSNSRLQFTFTAVTARFFLASSTMFKQAGLNADSGAFAAVQTFNNIVNLIGQTDIYVHSRAMCSGRLIEKDGVFSVVDVVQVDKPYGAMCYANINDDEIHKVRYFPYESAYSLKNIDLKLRDSEGELLEIPDNFNMTVMMKIYHN